MVPSFEEDFAWQERFRGHFSEIARLASRVEVAAPEDDWKRNTDFELITTQNRIRFSARARRHEYTNRYKGGFTVRLRRPSGIATEMDKLRVGWGDMFIYGFESEPGSTRLGPWLLGNLAMLRDYIAMGGHYSTYRNKDSSSHLAVFHLTDMPPGFVHSSEGISALDRTAPWAECRNTNWTDPTKPMRIGPCNSSYVMPLDDNKQPGTGYWRRCLSCGFTWKAGWEMPLTQANEVTA